MDDERALELLQEAVLLLRILAGPQLRDLNDRFTATMLTSDKRRGMWDLMDGSRSLADIARQVEVSGEAVRQFVRDMEIGFPELIETTRGSGAQRPRRRVI